MKTNNTYKTITYIALVVAFSTLIVSCKKKEADKPEAETTSVKDNDNNTYKAIRIGNQMWMAEDLKVKTFRNGDPIGFVVASERWKDSAAVYCILEAAGSRNFLYNWYAVNDARGIAPNGWHIPTDAEWKELEQYLGMSATDADKVNWRGTHEGEKLKVEAPKSWRGCEGVWGNNESGFTALANGCRMPNGLWADPGASAVGFWWSSTLNTITNQAWYRHLDYKKANIFRFYGSKNYGCSIRCIKDEDKHR